MSRTTVKGEGQQAVYRLPRLPFVPLFSEYSLVSLVRVACACLAERSDATCSRQAHATQPLGG